MISFKTCYLSGAMFGLDDNGQDWRNLACQIGPPKGWKYFIPNVADDFHPRDLVSLDFRTILQCQAVIARVNRPGWGTAMELLFASQNKIPVIGWDAPTPYSPWLAAHVDGMTDTLEHAINLLGMFGVAHEL